MLAYSWPGNIRELENFMERLSILVDGDVIGTDDLPCKILDAVGPLEHLPDPEPDDAPDMTAPAVAGDAAPEICVGGARPFAWPALRDMDALGLGLKEFLDAVEERLLDEALTKSDGVKNQAAELLGIKRTTLIEKLKKRRED